MRFDRVRKPVRIVRILVYTFADPIQAIADQARWTHNRSDPRFEMRTASTLEQVIEDYAHPEEVRLLRIIHSCATALDNRLHAIKDDLDTETEEMAVDVHRASEALEAWYALEDHTNNPTRYECCGGLILPGDDRFGHVCSAGMLHATGQPEIHDDGVRPR